MFSIGAIIDQYKILSQVGQGSYGTVYAVENIVSQQKFALKTVSLRGTSSQRELDAIKRYRNLRHPNLIHIHHVGIVNNTLYYTMDWAEDTFLTRRPESKELKSVILQLLEALELLHDNNFIHRDIKPDNILWVNDTPVLGDIGLLSNKETVSFAGSPGFIPPAIWQGKELPNEYSDIYALAKVLYLSISNCSLKDYPNYRGARDQESSQLFNAVLKVCEENSYIRTSEDFQKLLHSKVRRQIKVNKSLIAIAITVILASSVFSYFAINRDKNVDTIKSDTRKSSSSYEVMAQAQVDEILNKYKNMNNLETNEEYRTLNDKLKLLQEEKSTFEKEIDFLVDKKNRCYSNHERRQSLSEMSDTEIKAKYKKYYDKWSNDPKNEDLLKSASSIMFLFRNDLYGMLNEEDYKKKYSTTLHYRYYKLEQKLVKLEMKFHYFGELDRKVSFAELEEVYKKQLEILRKQRSLENLSPK